MSIPEINGKPMQEHHRDDCDINWRLVENNIEISVYQSFSLALSEFPYWGVVQYKGKSIFHPKKSATAQGIVNQIVAFVNELRADMAELTLDN
jgi:hypothetical protein